MGKVYKQMVSISGCVFVSTVCHDAVTAAMRREATRGIHAGGRMR